MVRKGWKQVTLGDIALFQGGSQPPLSVFSSQKKAGYIRLVQIRDYKTDKYATYIPEKLAKRVCKQDDIMIGRYGPPIFQILRGIEGAYNVALIKALPQGVDKEFLYHTLKREDLFQYIDLLSRRTSGQTGVDLTNLKAFELSIPVLTDEQAAIAKALSDVDSLTSSLQKLIEKKKAIKQGAMQELLTGKKRLPGFSGEWRTYKLGELGSFDKGCGISRAESNTGNFPAVRYGELYTKHTDYVKQYYSHISADVAQTAKRVTFGNILFAASGETKEEIGVCAAIVDRRDIFAGGDIVVFTPTTEINPIFFGTLLNMSFVQKQKSERGQGDAVVHIHADSLSEIIVSMPEKNEQEAIAAVIKDFNDEIEQLEKKLVKYQQIKQGMMQELLTGRIKLVDADGKEHPKTQILQEKQSQPAHNQHFDDAVMIAGIVNAFYSEKYPLGRKKVQKLLYLVGYFCLS